MNSNSSNKHYTIVPPEELRCVWMSAGILSYQLCDRKYDCERCPLDIAMRSHFTKDRPPERNQQPSESAAAPPELREGYHYSTNHCWLKQMTRTVLRIGIEPGLASALLLPRSIVLPAIGQRIEKGSACVWIVLAEGTLPITAPVTGEIVGRNTRAVNDPKSLLLQPYDQGWLFEVRVQSTHLKDAGTLNLETAGDRYAKDARRFTELLLQAVQSTGPEVGVTLADGGKPLQELSGIVGPKKYFSLLRQVFS